MGSRVFEVVGDRGRICRRRRGRHGETPGEARSAAWTKHDNNMFRHKNWKKGLQRLPIETRPKLELSRNARIVRVAVRNAIRPVICVLQKLFSKALPSLRFSLRSAQVPAPSICRGRAQKLVTINTRV